MIGERLTELRKDKGMSQKMLATELSCAWQTISSYEREASTPDDETKVKLAKIFNVSIDYLLGLIDEELPYSRNDYIALPNGYTNNLRNEVINYMGYLTTKPNMIMKK